MKLSELKKGEHGQIIHVGGEGQLRRHFLDMGLIEGTGIEYMKTAPMGDPIEYRIWGYELTLRKDDAACIDIELVDEKAMSNNIKKRVMQHITKQRILILGSREFIMLNKEEKK